MGSLRKKSVTKTLPTDAELKDKIGKDGTTTTFARWIDGRGKTRTAPTTTGKDGSTRIVVESSKWFARFRDSGGFVVERSTGCKDRAAAESLLKKWERQTELVNAEVITASEAAISDHARTPLDDHLDGFIRSLKAAGRSKRHITDTDRLARQIAADCGFRVLRDIEAERVEVWLVQKLDAGMAARTRNSYLQALKGFCTWCVRNRRLTSNPLQNIDKADEKADRRLVRRALTELELLRLLYVTRWRPLAELGRETIRKPASKVTAKRDTWNPARLTFETIDAAVELARTRLVDKPDRIAELEEQGRERALIVKTLVLTGLRSGELRSITIGQVHLDEAMPFIELAAKDEKNRDGSDVPLRDDLADDLRNWLRSRQTTPSTLRIDGGDAFPPSTKLFYVPSGLRRILDRDLQAAGIPKKDDRGRTIDVHALRHTFGTMLSQNGVAPRTAQSAMRHSKIDLTMNCYTDPRLLDVAGALDQLPAISLNRIGSQASETALATGTDDQEDGFRKLAPMLAKTSVPMCVSGTKPAILGKTTEAPNGESDRPQNIIKHNEKDPVSLSDNGSLMRVSNGIRTRDLRNHNPAL